MAILVPPIFPQQMALPSLPLLTSPSHTQSFFTLRRINTAVSLAETRLGATHAQPSLFWGEARPKIHTAGLSNSLPPRPKIHTTGAFPLPLYPHIPTIPILTAAVAIARDTDSFSPPTFRLSTTFSKPFFTKGKDKGRLSLKA